MTHAPITLVETEAAPAAVGPYAQAIACGGFVFCSGQLPMDPRTGELVQDDVAAAADQALRNLTAVLAAAGLALADVVKTTVYLKSMDDFAAINTVYAGHFGAHRPARACVEVARLPRDARLEIDAIACRPAAG